MTAALGPWDVPIAGIAGDQQSALFGQLCTKPGDAKCTYGTGCFLLENIGAKFRLSQQRLVTTLACSTARKLEYALEGSIFIGGAVVQWLRDKMRFFPYAPVVESIAGGVPDAGGVVFVPAFTGLGAPHWDPYASGMIIGIGRDTGIGHIARAAIESIAFQVADVLKAMDADTGIKCTELRVDGGAAANDLLMQFQADLLGIRVNRPGILESTAQGAAYLAGLATGFWTSVEEIAKTRAERVFEAKAESCGDGSALRQVAGRGGAGEGVESALRRDVTDITSLCRGPGTIMISPGGPLPMRVTGRSTHVSGDSRKSG